MSEHMVNAIEVVCVFVIAVGIGFIYWPASLIVGGLLVLIGLQGLSRRVEDGE